MADPIRIPLVAQDRTSIGEVDLPSEIFGAPKGTHLLYEAVKMQLASRRSGSAATKTRAFVSGGGKKPWKQKGTGRARQGSTRAAQWVGGGTAFGPQPRDYSYRLPRSARRRAICLALSTKLREGNLVVVDRLEVPSGKTRDMVKALSNLECPNALIVVREAENALFRSTRNIPRAKVIEAIGVNVYDILLHDRVILTRDGLEALKERLSV